MHALDAGTLHRGQMLATGNEHHVMPRLGQGRGVLGRQCGVQCLILRTTQGHAVEQSMNFLSSIVGPRDCGG